jgi:hypothetical protein
LHHFAKSAPRTESDLILENSYFKAV